MKTRNWDLRLFRWADRVVGKPFKWGKTDCGSLVSEAHRVMHGEDLLGWPPYKSKRGAVTAKAKVGGIANALSESCVEVGRRFARTGDVVLVEHEGEDGMGMVVGSDVVGTHPGVKVMLVPMAAVPDGATFWRLD